MSHRKGCILPDSTVKARGSAWRTCWPLHPQEPASVLLSSNPSSSQAVLLSKASAPYYWICFSPTSSWKLFPISANSWDCLLPRRPSLNSSWIISLQSKPGLNVSLCKNHLYLLIIALSFLYCLKCLLLSCHPDTSRAKATPYLFCSNLYLLEPSNLSPNLISEPQEVLWICAGFFILPEYYVIGTLEFGR